LTATSRLLDPQERTSEILFGLIMALGFTGSLSAATAGHEEIRTMLFGALGCNLAWGLVDAVMYLLSTRSQRGAGRLAIERVRGAADPAAARVVIAEAMPPFLAERMRPGDLEHLRTEILKLTEPPRAGLRAADFRGAAGVFLLVFFSTFPLVVPFLVMHDAHQALRASHAIAIALLYFNGHVLGRFSGSRPVLMGLSMVALGLLLAGLTILLGG
jgi:VIT1/CCC1 family predicted Fe2+/Mn2+ transporter